MCAIGVNAMGTHTSGPKLSSRAPRGMLTEQETAGSVGWRVYSSVGLVAQWLVKKGMVSGVNK